MEHVKLVSEFAGYKAGSIFGVVSSRDYWGSPGNCFGSGLMSDGAWIGLFPTGYPTSKHTHHCVTQEGLQANMEHFQTLNLQ